MLPEARAGWEPLWADDGPISDYWRTPEPAVLAWARVLQATGRKRVLDLGCGVGRHTVALARLGLNVVGSDVSSSGLAACSAWLAGEGLAGDLVLHGMEALPFSDGVFDGLVAYNVIYHTTLPGMQRILAEIHRVLCPGGRVYATVIARQDDKVARCRADLEAGVCRELEPFTFIYQDGAPDDKYLPHHYSDVEELGVLWRDFEVDVRLERREYDEDGLTHVGVHYHVQGARRR